MEEEGKGRWREGGREEARYKGERKTRPEGGAGRREREEGEHVLREETQPCWQSMAAWSPPTRRDRRV